MTTPTPRTDAVAGRVYPPATEVCPANFARQLERELNQWKEDAERLAEKLLWHLVGADMNDSLNKDSQAALDAHKKLVKGEK